MRKWSYLGQLTSNGKNKDTFFPQTFKVEEKKVPLFLHLEAIWATYGNFLVELWEKPYLVDLGSGFWFSFKMVLVKMSYFPSRPCCCHRLSSWVQLMSVNLFANPFSSGILQVISHTRSFFLVLFRFPFSWAVPVPHCLLLIKYNWETEN